jgi:hypothetical protein
MLGSASGRLVVENAANELWLRVIQRKPNVRTVTMIMPPKNNLVFFMSLLIKVGQFLPQTQ